jgi:hypothetical protein
LGYWLVQTNDNKFATGQILKKPVEVVKGRILAGGAQTSPEPCDEGNYEHKLGPQLLASLSGSESS